MKNITHFKLPVFVAAGLHGALFLAVPTTRPPIAVTEEVKPSLPFVFPAKILEMFEPAEVETGVGASGGPAVSTLADIVVAKPSPLDFTVPVVAIEATKGPAVTLADPPNGPGDGQGPWTGIPGPTLPIPDFSALDRVPRATVQPAPDYPGSLRQERVTGSVTVAFLVDREGRVISAQALRYTHREFAEPAVRAVLKWRFEPGKHHGRPTSFRMAVPIEFRLEGD